MVMPNPSAVDFRTQKQIEFDKFAEEQAKDNLGLDTKAARDAIAAKREGEDAKELAAAIAVARNEREKRERLIDDKVADARELLASERASKVSGRNAERGPEGMVNPGPGYTDEGATAFDGPGGSGAAYESTKGENKWR